MNISRIVSITPDGTWQSRNGLLHQLLVSFEDNTTGQANAKSPNPPYRVGDEVGYEITGSYPGGSKIKIHKDPYGSGGRQGAAPTNTRTTAAPRAAAPAAAATIPVGRITVNGQTVGMAMKEALALLTKDLNHDEVVGRVITPVFWASVHEVASDIIRVSALLEAGNLAKPIKDRVPEGADVQY